MKKQKFKLILTLLVITAGCTTDNLTSLVDPFIGTGGHGHTYPGASVPFGMVQLSPDTRLTGWDGCSGYHYSDSVIYGFSHTHLSGTGVSDYGDVLFMPTTGEIKLERGSSNNTNSGYCSKFSHNNEFASPGYYSVTLDDYEIDVELTVTERTGFHKYTFPENEKSNIIIDLEHRDFVIESGIKIVSDTEIEGFRRSRQWAADQHIYFVANFSKPFNLRGIALNDTVWENINEANGRSLKAFVQFNTSKNEDVMVKVGISAVSIEGARKNAESEISDWDFDKTKELADNKWENQLNKIRVSGGTKQEQSIFYTSLYHTSLSPNLYMDTDGKYRGRDLKVHQLKNRKYYTVFSLWDTFRATHPLFTIIEPEKTLDFIKTFIDQYEQGGTLPVWELGANETMCMIGYHSVPVIVDAFRKGIKDFDTEKALEAMKHSADLDHLGLKYYRESGYIPANEEGESVSKTLEYAYDDWCIAMMAKDMGREEDYERFIERALYYKNIYDSSTGFMRAKMSGSWFSPFDPREVNFNYTEANCWQYSFFVPQDIEGLMKLSGGEDKFVSKLDELFSTSSETTGRDQADITGLIGQYAHGNEPSHHMVYLYNYAGFPWKTQEKVKQILKTMYSDRPDGLSGNEDCGQMSAWYVLSAIGFYPVCPGDNTYIIGSPVFKKVNIKVDENKVFTVIANNVSEKNIYIQSATLNGETYNKSFIKHQDIINGGELVFEMGSKPSKSWGVDEANIPRSAINENLLLPVPYIEKGDITFTGSTEIILGCIDKEALIYYTLDGSNPDKKSKKYSEPLIFKKTTTLRALAIKDNMPDSKVLITKFSKIPSGRSLELFSTYSPQYSAGGDMALIDFIRGPENFRTGSWQGYHGIDLVAVVDLGEVKNIKSVASGFLQDVGSWIFFPESVEFDISNDGIDFRSLGAIDNNVAVGKFGVRLQDFSKNINTSCRYIKMTAKTIGVCPDWHPGAGSKAWIFCDEIVIN